MNTCNHTNFKPSEAEKEHKRLQRFAQTAVVPKGNDRHFVIALLEQGAEGVETPLPIEGLTIQRVRLTPDNGNDPIAVKHKLYTPETLGVELTKAHQEALGLGGYTLSLEGRIPDANFEDGFRDFTLTKPLCRVVNPEDYAPEASAPNNPLRLILSELVKGEKGEKGDAGERGEKGEQGGRFDNLSFAERKNLSEVISESVEFKRLEDKTLYLALFNSLGRVETDSVAYLMAEVLANSKTKVRFDLAYRTRYSAERLLESEEGWISLDEKRWVQENLQYAINLELEIEHLLHNRLREGFDIPSSFRAGEALLFFDDVMEKRELLASLYSDIYNRLEHANKDADVILHM